MLVDVYKRYRPLPYNRSTCDNIGYAGIVAQEHYQLYAHRGCKLEQDENTLTAFKNPYEKGVRGFEVDIRRPADGVFIVSHDASLLPKIEEKLKPFDPWPHWAKLFAISPNELRQKYEKMEDFKNLSHRYDPKGKFKN